MLYAPLTSHEKCFDCIEVVVGLAFIGRSLDHRILEFSTSDNAANYKFVHFVTTLVDSCAPYVGVLRTLKFDSPDPPTWRWSWGLGKGR
jgi:hypothetical protein